MMDKYVSTNKLKAKIISGEPVLFSEATQHEIFFLLELEPSEDVEPVTHAHWKLAPEDTAYDNVWVCSNCGEEFTQHRKPKFRFCPNCGAKMDADERHQNE